jgi:precorrin-3B C17-methyltransferase
VKSGYRSRQNVQLVTLDEMADCDIGMLTTVLIGNSSTFERSGLMVTPRGYANKYDKLSGETKDGEQAGRSLSMGLDGWKSYVRTYLRDTPNASLVKAATYFNRPLAEILEAVVEASEGDLAGEFTAIETSPETQLNEIKMWGNLQAVVRNQSDAIAELFIVGSDLELKNNRLSIVNPHFHLHIDWQKVTRCFAVKKQDKISVYFTDLHGERVFSIV